MESKSITKQFHSYLWAFILVALSACMGNVVDGIIVGNLISEDDVSAINLSKPINQFIFTLHLLINAGAGMLVAFALGRNNLAEARRYFTRALSLSACLGLLLTIFGGLLFPDATARMLCSNDHILPLASDYMRVLLIGSPVYILMFGLSTMVGVDGKPKLVSLAVIVDNVLNLFLDIVFIKWFDWGIAGSSSATVVRHVVGIAILLTHWWKPENRRLRFDFSLPDSVPARSLYGKIVSQGAPLAIASICLTLLLFSANSIVLSTLGRTGIFAFAVCMNLLQIYNLGDEQGLRMVLRHAFRFITVAMIVTCVYVLVWPQSIVYLFGADEADFVTEGARALRIFSVSFIPFCYIYVMMIVYKLYGHHRMALFISFALSLTVIPVLWIMSRTSPQLLWYSYLIAYAIVVLVIVLIHKLSHVELKLKAPADTQT